MSMIRDNISRLKDDISLICRGLGRNPGEITLVAVTKFASLGMVKEAIGCGITHIGENKIQEAQKKFVALDPEFKVSKHMIGHLQTNKVKDALKVFDLIQSVDSIKLAHEIEKQAGKVNRNVDVLIQVSTSGEEQKFGVPLKEARSLLKEASNLPHIRIKGLMTIAPLTEDEDVIRDCFRKLREVYEQIKNEFQEAENTEMKYLSMGMTSDYKIALEEGSNMLRIGRAVFTKEEV